MLDLSPTKLFIIFVVAVVLLGPKRLPEVARQLGVAWRKVRELHLRLDRELRESLPDLPSSRDIVRFARSPVTLLDQLADRHDDRLDGEGAGAAGRDAVAASGGPVAATGGPIAAAAGPVIAAAGPGPIPAASAARPGPGMPASALRAALSPDTDDPNLN